MARFRAETYWGRPVPGFGDPEARILIVGLAPAAHGGNRTGRVFTGDAWGDFLFAAMHAVGLVRQARRVQRGEQEVARRIAGEHPTRPVAAVRRRREPDEQDPRRRVTEPGHRPAPVRLVAEAGDLLDGDGLAPRDEARAGRQGRSPRRARAGAAAAAAAARAYFSSSRSSRRRRRPARRSP